jgi:hypothetical protein
MALVESLSVRAGLHHPHRPAGVIGVLGDVGTVVEYWGRVGDRPIIEDIEDIEDIGTREAGVTNKAPLQQHRFITGVNSGTLTGESCLASN